NGKKQVSFYKSGSYWDLCRGGHVEHPDKELLYFKLLSVAGAYWKGSEKNPMLTRIYGTVFPTQKELDEYIKMQEEAKKRDHKKLGPAMELFLFHETAPGSPYWLPKGLIILNELLNFWRVEHAKRGYLETSTPLINKKSLWETSGHWDHYKDSMFIADMGENDVYGVKAMNCPNAMVIFGSKTRSYKDLPLRLSDSDVLHRYEKSGELNGLFRVRMFRQDDSHNFISEDQIETEYKEILDIAEQFYGIFNLDYKLRLGTRPEKYMGDKKSWDKAESTLRKILKKSGKEFFIMEGDGAFYGPKVDILMKDAIGREWQMGTIQLDFQQPRRFNLKYTDKDGSEKTPVVVHRVIYGSIERFIGILIENFAGSLIKANIRTELDDRSETLSSKIRDAQNDKVPYMIIIGDKEEKAKKVAVRLRTEKDLGQKDLQEFIKAIKANIENKSLEL
ncbi:MAG: Threonine-tRNA ligase, partial [Candidatus Woesebacteria bacterium GW2011_GWA1_37_7]